MAHPGLRFRLRHGDTPLIEGNSDDYHFVSKVALAPGQQWYTAYSLPSGIALDISPVMLTDWQEVSDSIAGLCIECLVLISATHTGIIRTEPGPAELVRTPKDLWEAGKRGYVLLDRETGNSVGGYAVTNLQGVPLCVQHGVQLYRHTWAYGTLHPSQPEASIGERAANSAEPSALSGPPAS